MDKKFQKKTETKPKSRNRGHKTHSDMRKDKPEFTTDKDNRSKGSNDPLWYSTNPAILRDAASIPFSWSNGTPIDLNMPTSYPDGYIVPGIMSLCTSPTVGYSKSPTSPLNVASTAVYSFVRHANSGHSNYDSPDLMLYLIAMGDIYAYINYLQRVYACATLYSQRNRYLPDGLLRAQMVDGKDVQSHLADFRYGINVLVHKAASLAVPAEMTYFRRTAFMYQNVYTEGSSIKDQLYMYVPANFRRFTLEDTTKAGMLESINFTNYSTRTVQELLEFGNNLLSPILSSEDMNIMSGDILKAYGTDKLIKLMEVPEYLPIIPIFNIGVLEQMKNARRRSVITNTIEIRQSSNKAYLVSQPRAAYISSETFGARHLMTTTTDEVTPELVIESSRLMTGLTEHDSANKTAGILCGSEIVRDVSITSYDATGALNTVFINDELKTGTENEIIGTCKSIGMLSNFRFHPFYWINKNDKAYPVFDLDNYAVLTGDNVNRLHEAALLSLFNVPSIAKAAT